MMKTMETAMSGPSHRKRSSYSLQRVCLSLIIGGFLLFCVCSEQAVLRKLVRVSVARSVGVGQLASDNGVSVSRRRHASNSTNIITIKSNMTAGFIHVGKTGGSTLCGVIRNSCHSFMRKRDGTCRNRKGPVPNETVASELVTAYYHVPDIDLIPASRHDLYYVSIRDPYERFKSAFTSTHPRNRIVLNKRNNGIPLRKVTQAYECFPTLEAFAMHLGNATSNNNCTQTAREAIHGNVPIMVHMYGNYQKYAATIPLTAQAVFVVRTRHLWDDWTKINKMLDPNRDVVVPHGRHERNVQNLTLPVTRDVSPKGRDYICANLKSEYQIYFDLLERAANMNATDIQDARNEATSNCPNVDAW